MPTFGRMFTSFSHDRFNVATSFRPDLIITTKTLLKAWKPWATAQLMTGVIFIKSLASYPTAMSWTLTKAVALSTIHTNRRRKRSCSHCRNSRLKPVIMEINEQKLRTARSSHVLQPVSKNYSNICCSMKHLKQRQKKISSFVPNKNYHRGWKEKTSVVPCANSKP